MDVFQIMQGQVKGTFPIWFEWWALSSPSWRQIFLNDGPYELYLPFIVTVQKTSKTISAFVMKSELFISISYNIVQNTFCCPINISQPFWSNFQSFFFFKPPLIFHVPIKSITYNTKPSSISPLISTVFALTWWSNFRQKNLLFTAAYAYPCPEKQIHGSPHQAAQNVTHACLGPRIKGIYSIMEAERGRERERESTLHISMCYHFIYALHLKHIFVLQFWFQRSKKIYVA